MPPRDRYSITDIIENKVSPNYLYAPNKAGHGANNYGASRVIENNEENK